MALYFDRKVPVLKEALTTYSSGKALSSLEQSLSTLGSVSYFRRNTTTYWLQNLGFRRTWIRVPATPPVTFWMVFNQYLNFSKPRFSCRKNGDHDFTYVIVLLWGFNERVYRKHTKSKVSLNICVIVTCHVLPKVLSICAVCSWKATTTYPLCGKDNKCLLQIHSFLLSHPQNHNFI